MSKMTETGKRNQLLRYKVLATGLFLLMMAVFVAATYLQKHNTSHWIGYVRAFSEAAMVGALADWFAVTALFHYPLGFRIPHTNLIAKSKQRIGDNLGSFVVENFLSSGSIRPYIEKIRISAMAGEWLLKERNRHALSSEAAIWIKSAIEQMEDNDLTQFINRKIKDTTDHLHIGNIASKGIIYFLNRNELEEVVTFLSAKVRTYILESNGTIRESVRAQSYRFIPNFVDRKIADKITLGLAGYFEEVSNDPDHPLRHEIEQAVRNLAGELEHTDKWEEKLQEIKNAFLSEERLLEYAADIWTSLKNTLLRDLDKDDSPLQRYLKKNISQLAVRLTTDKALQVKIDSWFRFNAYRFILRNAAKAGELISHTVGSWEEAQLSRKLELEVGKDLQFIRINGTLVGGLVGLIIYTIANFLI